MRLIDADRLKREVLNWEDCPNGFSDTYDKARIIDEIDEQPTVEAEPIRHGKWEHGREISRGYIGDACIGVQYEDWKCSNCGIVCEQSYKPTYKYCPSCGCKMDLDGEGAET